MDPILNLTLILYTHSKRTACPTHAHRAIKHLLEALKPYTIENGGVLKVKHVWYVERRGRRGTPRQRKGYQLPTRSVIATSIYSKTLDSGASEIGT